MVARAAGTDGTFDEIDRVLREQLQHADVMANAADAPESSFEVASQVGERRGQLPVTVDRSVVERRRLAWQNRQEMPRIKQLLAAAVAAWVRGDHLSVSDNFDTIDVALDRHSAE